MQTSLSYNQLIGIFRKFAEDHIQINSFGHGDIWEIDTWKDINFPLLWVQNNAITTVSENTVDLAFQIIVMDLVKKDERNETEVLSDTQNILLDFHTHFDRSVDYPFKVTLPTLAPFTERFDSEVSGWGMDIQFKLQYSSNPCAVPGVNPDGLFIPEPPCVGGGGDVTIVNSDSTFVVNVSAPATYTLPDENYEVYVDSVLVDSGSFPVYGSQTININL
jgi:hypothetical protein